MELNDIYKISNAINDKIEQGELHKKVLGDLTIVVQVKPTILHGIDKEFYKLTHEGDTNGFVHSEEVNAVIDGIKFKIVSKS